MIGPSTLFQATLLNTGQPSRYWLEGEIKDINGRIALTFETEKRTLGQGSNLISASDMVMRSFNYTANELGSALRNFHRMPNGTYRFCLRIRTEGEGDDEFCDTYEVDDLVTLDLIQPWDRDTIDEVRPTLAWTMTSSSPAGTHVRLVLTKMEQGKTPAQAIGAGIPLFITPDVKVGPVPYPATLPDLERGKCYAWQVEEFVGNRVRERSAPWGFCISQKPISRPEKYVRIGNDLEGAVYHVVDDKIYFRYDESYSASELTCFVREHRSPDLVVQPATSTREAENHSDAPGATPKSIGMNLYEFDLTDHHLRPGDHILIIRNEKGREYQLQFTTAR